MVQYYTLEEAARILGTTPDELKLMAKRGELRPFQDRGTLRFRTQEVDELARRRGVGSDMDIPLGDAPRPKASDSPPSSKRKATDPGVFDFSLSSGEDDRVEIGQELQAGGSSSGKKSPSGRALSGAPSPPPKPGSDSDVRLVAEGSDLGFEIASGSDVKVVDDSGSQIGPKSGTRQPATGQSDSGIRLASDSGQASDSDVKIVGDDSQSSGVISKQGPKTASDSDVRLDVGQPGDSKVGKADSSGILTEEIDLDAELRQAEEAARTKKPTSGLARGKSKLKGKGKETQMPAGAPFELASEDMEATREVRPDSSDFDLTPASDSSPLSSSDVNLDSAADEEVGLGELKASPHDSGINLQDPADSGISLEQSSSEEEIEFELSLDEGTGNTPKPTRMSEDVDSDSEFELTLDDSGGLAPLEDEAGRSDAGEQDIFEETDFEVPALEDESGSQAVALDDSDSDLDSSDFDLALDDEDIGSDEESGSQVVALEEDEEVEEGAVVAPRGRRGMDEEDVDELLGAEDEEAVGRRAPAAVAAPAAPWDGWTVCLGLLPSAIILFLLTFAGVELIRGMWGYRQPGAVSGLIVDGLARTFTDDLPKR